MKHNAEWWTGFVNALVWVLTTFCHSELPPGTRHRIETKIREVENEHGI